MAAIKFKKEVSALPETLEANTLYMVRTGVGFDLYVSDSTGSVAHKVNSEAVLERRVIDERKLLIAGTTSAQIIGYITLAISGTVTLQTDTAPMEGYGAASIRSLLLKSATAISAYAQCHTGVTLPFYGNYPAGYANAPYETPKVSRVRTRGVLRGPNIGDTNRWFMGVASNYWTADVDPSTKTEIIGIGYDKDDNTIQIFHNDLSGIASKIDTGWVKPIDNTYSKDDMFELTIECQGRGYVEYDIGLSGGLPVFVNKWVVTVTNIRLQEKQVHTIETDVPSLYADLFYHHIGSTGGGASHSVTIQQSHVFFEVEELL